MKIVHVSTITILRFVREATILPTNVGLGHLVITQMKIEQKNSK